MHFAAAARGEGSTLVRGHTPRRDVSWSHPRTAAWEETEAAVKVDGRDDPKLFGVGAAPKTAKAEEFMLFLVLAMLLMVALLVSMAVAATTSLFLQMRRSP